MMSSSRRGGVLSVVMISVLAVIVVVAAGLVYAGFYLAHNVKVTKTDRHGEQTTVETPFGTVRVRERTRLDPKQIGIPVYPGAVRRDENKLASFELDAGDLHKSLSVAAAEFTTPDPVEKVCDFYRQELRDWVGREKHPGSWHFEAKDGGHRRIVSVRQEDGETHIGLASIGEPASN